MGRPTKFKENRKFLALIRDTVAKGVTYQTNVAAAIGISYSRWNQLAALPGSMIKETYETAVSERDAIIQRSYFDVIADPTISQRIRTDFIKTEKLTIDKRHSEDKMMQGVANPALFLSDYELLADLQKPAPVRLSQRAQHQVVAEMQTAFESDPEDITVILEE